MVTFNEQKLLIFKCQMCQVEIQFYSLPPKYGILILQVPCVLRLNFFPSFFFHLLLIKLSVYGLFCYFYQYACCYASTMLVYSGL